MSPGGSGLALALLVSALAVAQDAPGRQPSGAAAAGESAPSLYKAGLLSERSRDLSAAAAACAVSRSTLRRRLTQGAFPNAVRDADGAWTVPVGDLLAAGLRINAPRVAGEQAQPAVNALTHPAHQPPASLVEQGHSGAGEQALAIRVAELERALAVAEMRVEGAQRLAAERAARIDDLRGALRMLEVAPRPADGPPRRRWWWR